MTGATMFSGILAPEVATPEIDWQWCAEVDPFCSSLIAQRKPGFINLGDVTADDFIERAQALGPLDVLVAGSPCQAFSIAGARRSLQDSRGNLTLRLVEVVHALKPGALLWENVPGVLSTHDNAFGCFLGGLVGADSAITLDGRDGWPRAGVVSGPLGAAAWRTLDAQYFQLGQRRERVFLVFRPGATGVHPAEILFEWESLRRDYPPSRETGQGTTGALSARTKGGGGLGTDFDLDGGLITNCLNAKGGSGRIDAESETSVCSSTGDGVRRLTPRECERLMGFPDGYTLIQHRGKPVKDGPRYKALGNSMAVPVMRWLLRRIADSMTTRAVPQIGGQECQLD